MKKTIIRKDNSKVKKYLWMFVKCIIFAAISAGMTTLIHMLNSIFITHVNGKPEFVSNALIAFSMFEKYYLEVRMC